MKYFLVLIVSAFVLLALQKGKEDRKPLLCQKWRQYAFKGRSDSMARAIDTSMAKTMIFKWNGEYEENLLNSKGKGKWRFNDGQTKFGFTFKQFNGINLENRDTIVETNI